MVLDIFGGRPDAHPPPGGRRWLLRSRAAGSESPVPCSSPNMADGSRLRPPGERGDSSAPSRTTATPPRPRSTAASLPSHLFFFCSSTTASGSHWRSPLLPAARSPQHRDPPQQRGLSDSVVPSFIRASAPMVTQLIYTGERRREPANIQNTFNQNKQTQNESGSPSRTTATHKTQLKSRPGPSLASTVVTPHLTLSEAPPWDSRPVSGAGVVHYQLLHRLAPFPRLSAPPPLATMLQSLMSRLETYPGSKIVHLILQGLDISEQKYSVEEDCEPFPSVCCVFQRVSRDVPSSPAVIQVVIVQLVVPKYLQWPRWVRG